MAAIGPLIRKEFIDAVYLAGIYGAGEGTRTHNLLITNQLLCQLSYASIPSESTNTQARLLSKPS